ncbi:MAG: hypothetical protein ACF8R7_04305 [Phycisphaerales bacterium JB039]
MNRVQSFKLPAAAACVLAVSAAAQTTTYFDDPGDAVIRRTDPGAAGSLRPDAVLPDLIRTRMTAWSAISPATDPYTGSIINPDDAHLFRIDIEFAGLVNPPGPLGAGVDPWDPFRFGPSPVFGFLDIDLDDDKDSGGELGAGAELRLLANIGRFGGLPEGSIASRAARSAADYDRDFSRGPQFERSGADFAISFCGCWNITIIHEGGDGDGQFESGESWEIRGRFFERAGGFEGPSLVSGGSAFGAYDPWSSARWAHDDIADITTFTLVGPLDMIGAAQLFGGSVQPPDTFVDNHWSVEEAILDIIDSVKRASGPAYILMEGWDEFRRDHHLDPERWEASAIFGTTYADPIDALYIWTDVGFEFTRGDLTADGFLTSADADTFRAWLYAVDGAPADADGAKNGVFVIRDFGVNFSLYDLDGDGRCDGDDLYTYGDRADLDGDGARTFFDFLVFQNLFGAADMRADFDLDEQLTIFDFLAFQNAFSR